MQIPVLLPNIFNHAFTYESDKKLSPGTYVKVPFGRKDLTGVIWNLYEQKTKKSFKLKKIKSIINVDPLKIETIKFLNWFSSYNLVPVGMSLKLHLLGGEAIPKFDNKEYLIFNNKVNMIETNKELCNNRQTPFYNPQMSQINHPSELLGEFTNMPQQYENKQQDNMDSSLLQAFKEKPYTQSLQSVI